MKNIVKLTLFAVLALSTACTKEKGATPEKESDQPGPGNTYKEWTYIKEYISYDKDGTTVKVRLAYTYDDKWRENGYKLYHGEELAQEDTDYVYSCKESTRKYTSYREETPVEIFYRTQYHDNNWKLPAKEYEYTAETVDRPRLVYEYTYDSAGKETGYKIYWDSSEPAYEDKNYVYNGKKVTYDHFEYHEYGSNCSVEETYAEDSREHLLSHKKLDPVTGEVIHQSIYEYDKQWRQIGQEETSVEWKEMAESDDNMFVKTVRENYKYEDKVCTYDFTYYRKDGSVYLRDPQKIIYY